jgi:hypothetical protein
LLTGAHAGNSQNQLDGARRMGLFLCIVGFLSSFLLGRISVTAGLCSILTVGYLYGVVRANWTEGATYFLFDSAVIGFYLSLLGNWPGGERNRAVRSLQIWTGVLIGWALLMFLVPLQHPLIQLVGLRGNAFLLPFLVVGASLGRADARRLAVWLAVLNHVALAFALAEFVIGVEAFFPYSAVTELIYRSNDVADYTALRIPSCFANAHSFGGAMVMSLPWLIGAWTQPRLTGWQRTLLLSGTVLAMLGIFMCAARLVVVQLAVIVIFTTLSGKLRGSVWLGWAILLLGVGYIVSAEERFQRVFTLKDTDYVKTRVEGSVNMHFLDLLYAYPLGNGMGAGGTSIPYFLQHLLRTPMNLENEYCRIMLEQGVLGLALWVGFLIWTVRRWPTAQGDPWLFGRRLLWVVALTQFATALIGTGLMTSIPQSALFFLAVGFAVTDPLVPRRHPLSAQRKPRSVPTARPAFETPPPIPASA